MLYLIAPHNDDETLYAASICLRYKPIIIVVFDGYQHQEKFGIKIETRREESRQAAKILGCEIHFLGYDDRTQVCDIPYEGEIITPSKQGGNVHHDILSEYGKIHYATYTKNNLTPYLEGGVEVVLTRREMATKNKALECYKSQHEINRSHFETVRGKSEWLSRLP